MTANDLFGDALTDVANGPTVTAQGGLTAALMTRLHEKGMSLHDMGGPKIMERSERTMQAHARKLGLSFPDYVPMALRKIVTLVQMGDFFEVIGERAPEVAKLCGVVLTKTRGGDPCVGFPVHNIEAIREQLKAAFYIVKLVRTKKPRSGKAAA